MPVYVLFRCPCVFQLFFVCLGVGFSVSFRVFRVSVSLHALSGLRLSFMFILCLFVCLSCPCVFITGPCICVLPEEDIEATVGEYESLSVVHVSVYVLSGVCVCLSRVPFSECS